MAKKPKDSKNKDANFTAYSVTKKPYERLAESKITKSR
jgi:hypothetical protein